MNDRTKIFLATAFGLGLAPFAKGTFGTLLGVAVHVLVRLLVSDFTVRMVLLGVALVLSSAVTVALSPWAERYWKKKDPGFVVMDEVAGYLLVVLIFPLGANLWLTVLWAFLASRMFDIIKIPPARQLESLTAGWGILLDDLMSSVYAGLALHGAYRIVPWAFGG